MVRFERQEASVSGEGQQPSDPVGIDPLLEHREGGCENPEPQRQALHGSGREIQASGALQKSLLPK